MHEHLGTTFLQGLDRLIVYTIVSETRKFQREYGYIIGGGTVSEEKRAKGKKHNLQLMKDLAQFDAIVSPNFDQLNANAVNRYKMLIKQMANNSNQFIPMIVKIGKLQLLRKLVVRQIYFASKIECAQYTNCLETVNQSFLSNIIEIKENAHQVFLERADQETADLVQKQKMSTINNADEPPVELTQQQEQTKQQAEEQANKVMREMMKYFTTCLEYVGFVKPMNKVYSLSHELHHMPLVFALVTFNALQYIEYHDKLYSMVQSKPQVVLDGPHYIVGLLTIFKQYHNTHFLKYLMYLSNYFKNVIHVSQFQPQGLKQLPPEASPILSFLEELMRYEGKSRDIINTILGPYVFDYFIYSAQNQPT